MSVIKEGMFSESITRYDLLPLSFIERSPYTGSKRGLRYRLERVSREGRTFLRCSSWTKESAYACTAEADIRVRDFDFTDEGLTEATEYLNGLLTAGK